MPVTYYGEYENLFDREFNDYDELTDAILEEENRLHINKPYPKDNTSSSAADIFVMRRKIINRKNAPVENPGSRNLFDDLFDQAAGFYGSHSNMPKVTERFDDKSVAPQGTIFAYDMENGNLLFPMENLALYMADVADRKRNFSLKIQNASPEEIFSEKQLLLDELNEVERLASRIAYNALDEQVWDSFGAGYFNIQDEKRSEIVSIAHKAAFSAGIQANALRRGFSPDDLEVFQEVGKVIIFIDELKRNEQMVPGSNGIAGPLGEDSIKQYEDLRGELLNACNRNVQHPDIRRNVLNEISDVMNRIKAINGPLPQDVNWDAASNAAARQMPPKEEALVSISPAKAALSSLIDQLSAGETRFTILPPYNSTEYKELISSARQLLSDMENGCDLETDEGRERLNDLRRLASDYIYAKKEQMRERGKDPEKDMPSSSYGQSRFKAALGIEKLMNELQMNTRSRRFDRKELEDQKPLKDLVEKETKEYRDKHLKVDQYIDQINEAKNAGKREYEKYLKEKRQYQIDSIYQNIIYKEIKAYHRDKVAYEKAKAGCEKDYELLISLLKKNEEMAAQNITEENFTSLIRGREFTPDQLQAISRLRNEYIDTKINSMEGWKLPEKEYQKLREKFSDDFYRIGGKYYLSGDKLTLEEIRESDYSKALNQNDRDLAGCEIKKQEMESYKRDPAAYQEAKKDLDKEYSYIMDIINKDPANSLFVKGAKGKGLSVLASSMDCPGQYRLFFNDIKKQYIDNKYNKLITDLKNVYDDKVELSSAPFAKMLDELPPYWRGESTKMPEGKEFLKDHYIKLDKLKNLEHAAKIQPNTYIILRKKTFAKDSFEESKEAILNNKNYWLPDLPPEKEYLRSYYEDAHKLKKLEAEANAGYDSIEEMQKITEAKEKYDEGIKKYKQNINAVLKDLEEKRAQKEAEFGALFDRVIGKYYQMGGKKLRTTPITNLPEYAYEQYDNKVKELTRELKEKTGLNVSEAANIKKPRRMAKILSTSINEMDNREERVSLNSSSRRNSLSLENKNSKVL